MKYLIFAYITQNPLKGIQVISRESNPSPNPLPFFPSSPDHSKALTSQMSSPHVHLMYLFHLSPPSLFIMQIVLTFLTFLLPFHFSYYLNALPQRILRTDPTSPNPTHRLQFPIAPPPLLILYVRPQINHT